MKAYYTDLKWLVAKRDPILVLSLMGPALVVFAAVFPFAIILLS